MRLLMAVEPAHTLCRSPGLGKRVRSLRLTPNGFRSASRRIELIDDIRRRVALWRQGGSPGVTPTTARLLAYWKTPTAKTFFARSRRWRPHLPRRGHAGPAMPGSRTPCARPTINPTPACRDRAEDGDRFRQDRRHGHASMSQVVIENPVINSPFDEPSRHFRFGDEGITDEIVNRPAFELLLCAHRPAKKEGRATHF